MTTPSPDNPERLKDAIRKSCRDLPEPDPARMAAILRQVEASAPTRHRNVNARRWLPWLLLAGTTAFAAGYGYRVALWEEPAPLVGEVPVQPEVAQPAAPPAHTPARSETVPGGESPAAGTTANGRATLIYRR